MRLRGTKVTTSTAGATTVTASGTQVSRVSVLVRVSARLVAYTYAYTVSSRAVWLASHLVRSGPKGFDQGKQARAGEMTTKTRTGLTAKGSMLVGLGLLAVLTFPQSSALATPGDLDSTFGAGGIVTSNLNDAAGNDVAIQSDGKLVIVGSTGSCSGSGEDFSCHSEFLIERFDEDGSPDSSFGGGDGIVTTDRQPGYDFRRRRWQGNHRPEQC